MQNTMSIQPDTRNKMQNAMSLQPDTSLSICSTLESLLLDSVGPNGLHAMMTTSDDTTLISGDGHTIMTSLMMSHPVARWIIGHVQSHHGKTGDNAKSFILMLAEILRQILHKGGGSVTSCVQRQIMTELSFGLSELHSYLADKLLPEIAKYFISTSVTESNRVQVETICRNLIKTNFAGKFNPKAVSHMTDLLCKFVMANCSDLNKLDETILFLLDHFEHMFMEVTNEVVQSSRIAEGVTISRDFIFKSEDLDSSSTVKFVLLQDSFENLAPGTKATFQISNQRQMIRVLNFKGDYIISFIKHAKHYGINLIISSESLSEAALHECRRESISVIHMVPEDEITFIAQLAKVHILYGPSDVISGSKIGTARFCNSVLIGNSKFLNLGVAARQFLVCSPTKGVCRQWYAALRNALKCLTMWLAEIDQSCYCKTKDHNEHFKTSLVDETEQIDTSTVDKVSSLRITEENNEWQCGAKKEMKTDSSISNLMGVCIQGGGAFEFLVKKALTDLSMQSETSTSMSKACRLIADSIVCIPKTLYANSFVTKMERSSFIRVQSGIEANLGKGRSLMGIDGRTGRVCDMCEQGVVEPVKAKYLLLCDLVKTAQELLRIDAVVGVKGLLKDMKDDE